MLSPRGTALSKDIRARVMASLDAGSPKSTTAKNLQISRSTVYRYLQASQKQNLSVPEPRNQGGYRWSKLNRDKIIALARIALENPKLTIREISDLRARGFFLLVMLPVTPPSGVLCTKRSYTTRKHHFLTPKTVTDPIIVLEKRLFLEAQKRNAAFKASNLLFFDETLVSEHEQQHYAWSPASEKAKLPRPKGKAQGVNVLLTIGMGTPRILHYAIYHQNENWSH